MKEREEGETQREVLGLCVCVCVCVCVKWCFWGNTILVGFSKQKQSPHYTLFSLTTRRCFIPVPLSVKTLGCNCPNGDSESFRCSYFCSPLSEPTLQRLPSAPPLALARRRADHQAITRELGNREEIQSLKGLNTGRGSPLVASRGARCTPCWMGPLGGLVWGVSYTKDLAGIDWVCVIVYMNAQLFTNTHTHTHTHTLALGPDVPIHTAGYYITALG